jgi:hypothetical protein
MSRMLVCLVLSVAVISAFAVKAESAQRVGLVEYFTNTG